MKENKKHFEDMLRIEGVKAKGYGTVPKAIMRDRDLSLFAKAIYAYFCSLSGKGDTAFPGRDKILYDLQISKDAYYKGLKELTQYGYIRIEQENAGGRGKGFMRNVYTLVAKPTKYRLYTGGDPYEAKFYKEICQLGLDSQGYGMIPYAVMSDLRLRSQPKAVYGYLTSHIGADTFADLDATVMQYHLGLKDPHTCQGYIRQLQKLNYVNVVRIHRNGRLSKNRYYLVQTPDIALSQQKHGYETLHFQNVSSPGTQRQEGVLQDTQIQEGGLQDTQIQEAVLQDTQIQEAVLQDAQLQDAQLQDAVLQDAVSQDTTITSSTSNSFTIISSTNNSILIDRLISRIRKKICYQVLMFGYGDNPIEKKAVDDLVEIVAETMVSNTPRITIAGKTVLTSTVQAALTTINNTAATNILERFLSRVDQIDAKNHKQYLLTSIYQELLSPTAEDDGCEEDLCRRPG